MNYNSTPKCHLQILVKLPSINIIPLFITPTDFPVNNRLSKGEFDDLLQIFQLSAQVIKLFYDKVL